MSGGGPPVRVGHGLDVHAFAPGRKLILGGVEIASERGLAGHSDADVLSHAVCNAALGAAGLGDLGTHFPDSDPSLRGVSGAALLGCVRGKLADAGLRVCQVDATVLAQAPRLSPYTEKMSANLAKALGADPAFVNVKAVTTEKLGFVGREEGIEAQAVVVVVPAAAG
ncbi:MAG: 2-C-methyl-D-erythritol 2,4-cyclodiphosphate synthase [Myxococcota bacterium]